MNPDMLMIHYGELSTKGDNRKLFVNQLARNIRHALKSFPTLKVEASRDHAYVELHEEDASSVIARLQDVSGIHSISIVFKSDKNLDHIKNFAVELLSKETGKTFKVNVKRADKSFPMSSYELACALGDYCLDHTAFTVDVHHPDVNLDVDVRELLHVEKDKSK